MSMCYFHFLSLLIVSAFDMARRLGESFCDNVAVIATATAVQSHPDSCTIDSQDR